MALVNGSDYDHIDLHSAAGGDVTRHMLKDAQARGDVSDLKSAINHINDSVYTMFDALSPVTFSGTNSAVTDNGDGTYTVGTTSYGTSYFNTAKTLKAGRYRLFGAPAGFTYVTNQLSYTEVIAKNETGAPIDFVINEDTDDCRVAFRIAAIPATSFTIAPFLYRYDDNIDGLMNLADAHYTMYPTGDTTNRRLEIEAALATYKSVYFAPGEYTISAKMTMPSGTKIIGAGKSSVLVFGSGATGQMIECGNDCQISNIKIDGGLSSKPDNTSTNRSGIRVQDNKQTLQMHDCWIVGFGGFGVRVDATGYAQLSSVQIENCYFQYNGAGIYFLEHGEYGVVANCSFIDNYMGLYIQGGNNIVSGCAIERNTVGASVDGNNIDNSGHGAFIGCSFNHNTNTGLEIFNTTNGYVVSGCQFFRNTNNEISISASGVNVSGSNFGASTKLIFSRDCVATFSNNMFVGSPTVSYAENAITKSDGNYSFNGNKVNILRPGSIADENALTLSRYNASNIISPVNISRTVVHDIAYKAENGVFTFVSGTASSFTTINIGDTISSMPDGFSAGDRVYAHFRDTPIPGIIFQVVLYQLNTVVFETSTSGWFTMPDLSTALRIRIAVKTGARLNGETAMPYLGKAPTNGMLGYKLYPNDMPAMLTIIDDDAHIGFYNDVLPIIQSENVPIASAVPIVAVGTANHMTWAQIEECVANGAEILSHAYSHQTTYPNDWTVEQIEQDYQKAKNILLMYGQKGGNYLVFSGTTGEDDRSKEAAPYVYDIAINSAGNEINHIANLNKYRIKRYRIQTDTYNYDADALKALIDACISSGGWMVWMFHTSDDSWNTTAKANLTTAIQYAKTQGLPIVTVDHVYRTYIQRTL